MTEQKVMDKIIDDFIENRDIYREMKEDVASIIKNNDDNNEFNLTYDDFCIRCLNNMKKKDIDFDSTVKSVKQLFLESMVQIAIEELTKKGRFDESLKLEECLYGKN